jgi:hypothetical protein
LRLIKPQDAIDLNLSLGRATQNFFGKRDLTFKDAMVQEQPLLLIEPLSSFFTPFLASKEEVGFCMLIVSRVMALAGSCVCTVQHFSLVGMKEEALGLIL